MEFRKKVKLEIKQDSKDAVRIDGRGLHLNIRNWNITRCIQAHTCTWCKTSTHKCVKSEGLNLPLPRLPTDYPQWPHTPFVFTLYYSNVFNQWMSSATQQDSIYSNLSHTPRLLVSISPRLWVRPVLNQIIGEWWQSTITYVNTHKCSITHLN